MVRVELFSKEDCHLCEEAMAVLQEVRHEIPFELAEKKIVPGDPYYEKFSEKVPVVLINGEEAFHYRVNKRALREKLRQTKE